MGMGAIARNLAISTAIGGGTVAALNWTYSTAPRDRAAKTTADLATTAGIIASAGVVAMGIAIATKQDATLGRMGEGLSLLIPTTGALLIGTAMSD